MNRPRNADHAARTRERFVYSLVKITRLYDYQTWQTHFFEKFTRYAKVCVFFCLDCAFRMLIGSADKLRSRGYFGKMLVCFCVRILVMRMLQTR